MAYDFRPMTTADIPLVESWRVTPEVAHWWNGAIDANDLADACSRQWIVSHAGRPFAYLQDYDPHSEAGHPFAGLQSGSRGLDQFIGEPDMLGLGHGPALLSQHVDALFAAGAERRRRPPSQQQPGHPRL